MKAVPLTIHWHEDSSPVYSAHFEPNGKRLATAGGDNNVRLWSISGGEDVNITYLSTLAKHTQAVNVVRWCPRGEMLASAGDDGNVILWVQSNNNTNKPSFGEDDLGDKETWRQKHMCRSMGSEIYDLAWSPDGDFFITGSMDNIARIYDAQKGSMVRQIAEHSAYVQGVAWDPLNEYVATQSSDRSVHIYALKSKDGQFSLSQHNKISRMDLPPTRRNPSASPAPPDLAPTSRPADLTVPLASPVPSAPGTPTSFGLPMNPPVVAHSRASSFSSSPSMRRSTSPSPALPLPAVKPVDSPKLLSQGVKNHMLYCDDAMPSFFRRLSFTPDGSLLFTPAGQYKISHPSLDGGKSKDEIINTVYIYTRAGLNKPPVAHLPGHKKPSVAVSCSPVLYTFRKSSVQTKHITVDTSSSDESISSLPPPAINTEMDPPPTTTLHTSPPTSAGIPANTAFALPYRIVYAVATKDAVLIYDTQQQTPLCIVSNLHYAAFTDLTWTPDGNMLLITSTDGFCSVITFNPGELGNVYNQSATSNPMAPASSIPPPIGTEPPIKRPPSPFLVSGSSGPRLPARNTTSINTPTPFTPGSHGLDSDIQSNPTPVVSTIPGVSSSVGGYSLGAQVPWKTPPATPAGTAVLPAATVPPAVVTPVPTPPASATTATVLGKREPVEVKSSSSDAGSVDASKEDITEADKGGDKKRRRVAPTFVRNIGEDHLDESK
ncbi:Coronin-7 [Dactylella cylindrospora]|nr:Coronin-7 [Dactylella cylindrospora]